MTPSDPAEPIRCVLVGCGRISARHFEAIAAHPQMRLVALCDSVPERAQKNGETLGVRAFTSYEQMLDQVQAEVAILCTPSGLHPRHGIMAAARGLHVISEKPMATRLDEADALVRACDEGGVRLFVVSVPRPVPLGQERRSASWTDGLSRGISDSQVREEQQG